MTDVVANGLMKRRALPTHYKEQTHERLRQMMIDLESLDATLLQFDPKLEIETVLSGAFRPPKNWAKRGEMMRPIYSVLRRAVEPSRRYRCGRMGHLLQDAFLMTQRIPGKLTGTAVAQPPRASAIAWSSDNCSPRRESSAMSPSGNASRSKRPRCSIA